MAKMQRIVDLSSVPTGLKREFAFAVKAQMEMRISPKSRTRSGKVLHSGNSYQKPTRKRRRKSEPSIKDDPNAVASPILAKEIPPKIDDSALPVSPIEFEEKTSTSAAVQNYVSRNWNGKIVTYFRRIYRVKAKRGAEKGEESRDERETVEQFDDGRKEADLQMPRISLTRIPSNAKSLLRTGLLEGKNVRYVTRSCDKVRLPVFLIYLPPVYSKKGSSPSFSTAAWAPGSHKERNDFMFLQLL